jgi:hypothetical protein
MFDAPELVLVILQTIEPIKNMAAKIRRRKTKLIGSKYVRTTKQKKRINPKGRFLGIAK